MDHSRKIKTLRAAGILSGGAVLLLLLSSAEADFSGDVTLTSDYVWRGVSQTKGDPTLQVGAQYALVSGLYASAWGSNVKYTPDNGARSELNLAAGWSGQVHSGWVLDVFLLRYLYPSADERLDWNEVNGSLTWRDHYWLAAGYSDSALASETSGTYTQLGVMYPVNDVMRIEGAIARYFLDSDFADSYNHGFLGVIWKVRAPFELALTLHDTDSVAKDAFNDAAGKRVEIAVQASF